MTTHTNALQRPSEARRGLSRWEEVLAPSYRVIEPSRASQRVPAWVKRLGLNAKDLTVHHQEAE